MAAPAPAAQVSTAMEGVEDARPTLSPALRLDPSSYFSLLASDLCKMVRAHVDWNMHAGAPELVEEILDDLWDEDSASTTPKQRAARIMFYKEAIEEKRMGDPKGRVQLLLAQRAQIKALQALEKELQPSDARYNPDSHWYNARQRLFGLRNRMRSYDFHAFYWCEGRHTGHSHPQLVGFARFMPEPAFDRSDRSLTDAAYLNSVGLNIHPITQNNMIVYWSGYKASTSVTTFPMSLAAFMARRLEHGQAVIPNPIGNERLPLPPPSHAVDSSFYRRLWQNISGQHEDDLLRRTPDFTPEEEADLPEDADMPEMYRGQGWGTHRNAQSDFI